MAEHELEEFDFGAHAQSAGSLNDWKSSLIFGDPGAGKSYLSGSVSELGKTLLLDTEGGAASVARQWPNVEVIPVDSHEKLEFFVHKLLTTKHDYETVIVDTIGSAQARAEKYFRDDPSCISPKTGQIDGYAVFGKLKDWLVAPTYVDKAGVKRGGLAWKLHEAPFRAIIVAHAKMDRDEAGSVSIVPSLLGGAKDVISSIPDIVGYLTREDVEGEGIQRVLYVNSGGALITKNRFNLPDKIYKPTFKGIAELITATDAATEESK